MLFGTMMNTTKTPEQLSEDAAALREHADRRWREAYYGLAPPRTGPRLAVAASAHLDSVYRHALDLDLDLDRPERRTLSELEAALRVGGTHQAAAKLLGVSRQAVASALRRGAREKKPE